MARTRSPDGKKWGYRPNFPLALVAFLLDTGLLIWLLTPAKKTEAIVRYHYSGWRMQVIFLAALTVLMAANAIWAYYVWRKSRRKEPAKKVDKKPKELNLDTPEGVYEYVVENGPKEILEQLDLMNNLQARLDQLLIVNNHVTSLKEAQDLLQAIEDAICLNVKKAINFRIVGGEEAFNARLSKLKKENLELLHGAEELLLDLAEFINGGKGDIGTITRKIMDYRETIKEFLEDEKDEEDAGSHDDYFPTLRTRSM